MALLTKRRGWRACGMAKGGAYTIIAAFYMLLFCARITLRNYFDLLSTTMATDKLSSVVYLEEVAQAYSRPLSDLFLYRHGGTAMPVSYKPRSVCNMPEPWRWCWRHLLPPSHAQEIFLFLPLFETEISANQTMA